MIVALESISWTKMPLCNVHYSKHPSVHRRPSWTEWEGRARLKPLFVWLVSWNSDHRPSVLQNLRPSFRTGVESTPLVFWLCGLKLHRGPSCVSSLQMADHGTPPPPPTPRSREPIPYNTFLTYILLVLFLWRTLTDTPGKLSYRIYRRPHNLNLRKWGFVSRLDSQVNIFGKSITVRTRTVSLYD